MITNRLQIFIFLSLVACIFIAGVYAQLNILLNWDVSWLLQVTERLLMGGHYNKDFFEINPPMILYLYSPVIYLGKFFHLNSILTFRSYIFGLAFMMLILNGALIKKIFSEQDNYLAYLFLAALAVVDLIVPAYEFGQREHLLVILTMPYLLLMSLRLQGKACNAFVAIFIGFVAGLAFAMKPFFLATFLGVELYYLVSSARIQNALRPESITICAVLIAYAVVLSVFHQAYFLQVVPLVSHFYYSGMHASWLQIVEFEPAVFSVLVMFFFVCVSLKSHSDYLMRVLLIAVITNLMAYGMQQTLWFYHILPAYSFALMLLVLLLGRFSRAMTQADYVIAIAVGLMFLLFIVLKVSELSQLIVFESKMFMLFFAGLFFFAWYITQRSPFKGPQVWISFVLCVLTLSFPFYYQWLSYHRALLFKEKNHALIAFLKSQAAGQSVYFFTTVAHASFPAANYAEVMPISRTACLGWLSGWLRNQQFDTKESKAEKKFFTQMVSDDFKVKQPQWVFVDISQDKPNLGGVAFDHVKFFSEDKTFRALWLSYEYQATINEPGFYHYAVYQKKQGNNATLIS